MSIIKVVGFDPSFRNFGLAWAEVNINTLDIEAKRVQLVTTESRLTKEVRKNSDDLRRAKELIRGIKMATVDQTFAICEVPQGSQSARASWTLGIALCAVATCPIPMIQVSPTEVKMATVGKKNASKQEMIDWAMSLYPDVNWLMRKSKGKLVPTNANEHLADAVAVIHAGVLTDQFSNALAILKVA